MLKISEGLDKFRHNRMTSQPCDVTN